MANFNFPSNWGFILTALYLIVVGLSVLVPTLAVPPVVHGVLALAAGVLLLIGR